MKHFKKAFVLALSLCFAGSLVACGGNGENSGSTSNSDNSTEISSSVSGSEFVEDRSEIGENSSEVVEDSSLTEDGSTEDDSSESGSVEDPVQKAAIEALKAAIIRSEETDNYTYKQEFALTVKSVLNGEEQPDERITDSEIGKIDGNKKETISDQITQELPNGESKSFYRHYIHVYTDENSGISYNEENGEWTQGGFSEVPSDEDESVMGVVVWEQLQESIFYDPETETYTLTEYTIEGAILEDGSYNFGLVHPSEGVQGTIKLVYHKVEIQLKDGYLYKIYVDQEQDEKYVMEMDGVTYTMDLHMDGIATVTYENFNATVVELPSISN